MKNTFKKAAAVCVTLGLVFFISACATQKESISYEEKSYSIDADKVTQISLSDRDRKVELVESMDSKIHITYFESDKESYEVNITEENELVMKLVTDKDWKDYVGLDTDKAYRLVQIAVPSGISSGVNIITSKANIILSDVNIDGSVEATTSDGSIEITNASVSDNLKLKNKNDDIILSGVNAVGSIDATISNGNIEVTKVAVDKALKLKTKNGDITGTIIGSYDAFNITSDASKGKNNLPENKSSGDKTLEVSANNGDINLEFVD
ncbi:DUF4097 family beta strand repeat-containing protein [Psychrobacillus sp.]|uniref:DUF4097 family beta strand repeat-containing protein n=1 Tax=Psychrobacillus sp. TaxID=1871623 RepID=UPI0028BD199C|nr:DUF4097 family beta strand repeat-containing protein [Psychrobacillus sp.]